jgi:hypothetical protein
MSAPLSEQQLAEIRAVAERAAARPLLVSDCEGEVKVWALSALKHVTRTDDGIITGWSEPGSYRAADLVAEVELDMGTWDPGEDMDDDQRRQDINDLVDARNALPALLADNVRLRARVAELEAPPRLCDCGAEIPAAERKAYCGDRCRWADQDHGSDDVDGGEES